MIGPIETDIKSNHIKSNQIKSKKNQKKIKSNQKNTKNELFLIDNSIFIEDNDCMRKEIQENSSYGDIDRTQNITFGSPEDSNNDYLKTNDESHYMIDQELDEEEFTPVQTNQKNLNKFKNSPSFVSTKIKVETVDIVNPTFTSKT